MRHRRLAEERESRRAATQNPGASSRRCVIAGLALLCALLSAVPAGAVSETQEIISPEHNGEERFGWSVAVSGDTMVVGMPGANWTDGTWTVTEGVGVNAGAAYVFVRSGGAWVVQAKLTTGEEENDYQFGRAVGISGDTIVVGTDEHDGLGTNAGAAYVFVRSGDTWTGPIELIGSGTDEYDRFGGDVAVSGDTVVVGARGVDSFAGRAYVFVRSGDLWTEQTSFTGSDPESGDYFGASVAVDGDTAIIGAYGDGDSGTMCGSASVFVRSGSAWSSQDKLTAACENPGDDHSGAVGDFFGFSVALDGNVAVVGAPHDDDAGTDAGSAHVFLRSGSTWSPTAILLPDDGDAEAESFGYDVAVEGDVIAVAAPSDTTDGEPGSAYVFDWSGSDAQFRSKLESAYEDPHVDGDDELFRSVGYSESIVVAGASKADGFVQDGDVLELHPDMGVIFSFDLVADIPDDPSGTFVDDDGSVFEADIEWLAAAGVTRGCNPPVNDRFCPDEYVTRGQMAAFLVRAFGYSDAGEGDLFVDDDDSIFEGDIDRLGTAGVTRGCNPPVNDRFCPDESVTRGQMAAFLHRAMG